MTDKEFVSEVGPWGFTVTAVAMLGIFVARLVDGDDVLQSAGYSLLALLLIPFIWLFAARYASYWLTRGSKKQVVRYLFIPSWAAFTAKLFFLPWPQSASMGSMLSAAACAVFSGYAAAHAFPRIASGQIEALHDATVPSWLLHPILGVTFVILLLT